MLIYSFSGFTQQHCMQIWIKRVLTCYLKHCFLAYKILSYFNTILHIAEVELKLQLFVSFCASAYNWFFFSSNVEEKHVLVWSWCNPHRDSDSPSLHDITTVSLPPPRTSTTQSDHCWAGEESLLTTSFPDSPGPGGQGESFVILKQAQACCSSTLAWSPGDRARRGGK